MTETRARSLRWSHLHKLAGDVRAARALLELEDKPSRAWDIAYDWWDERQAAWRAEVRALRQHIHFITQHKRGRA